MLNQYYVGAAPAAGQITAQDITLRTYPANGTPFLYPGSITAPDTHPTPLPPGISNVSWTATSNVANTSPNGNDFVGRFFDSTHTFITNAFAIGFANNAALQQSGNITIPGNAAFWDAYWVNFNNLASYEMSFRLQFFCSGDSPLTLETPCCPPDPVANQLLVQINTKLDAILNGHAASSAQGIYVDGVRHSNLSGTGLIHINPSSRAIRMEVNNPLTSWPNNPGTPNYYFSLGFATPFAGGTPLKGQRLVYNHQVFSWPTYTDAIGYTLYPDVNIDLIELS